MANNENALAIQMPVDIKLKADTVEIIKAISPTIEAITTESQTILIITDINGEQTVSIPHYHTLPSDGVTWGDLFGTGRLNQNTEEEP
jgi:hypothetical protein